MMFSFPDEGASIEARLLWATTAHDYDGECPDELEGWSSRSTSCIACYATDFLMQRAGFFKGELVIEPYWEAVGPEDLEKLFRVAMVLLDAGHPPALMLDLVEMGGWARERAFMLKCLEMVEPFMEPYFLADPQLRTRWEELDSVYTLACPPSPRYSFEALWGSLRVD